jgi:hypothetical protein
MMQGMQQQQYNTLILQILQMQQSHTDLRGHVDTQFSNLSTRMEAGFNQLTNNVRVFGNDIRGAFAVGVNGAARRQRQQHEDPVPATEPAQGLPAQLVQ